MVRVYTSKTTRGDYGQGNLANALAAIQNGQALKAAARDFGVPPKTLRRHRDGNVRMPGSISLGPICQVLYVHIPRTPPPPPTKSYIRHCWGNGGTKTNKNLYKYVVKMTETGRHKHFGEKQEIPHEMEGQDAPRGRHVSGIG